MRKLRIGTETLRFAAGHKDRIAALAFAILIKQERINSLIMNASQRKLKETFGMGSDKLKRLVRDGVRFGFLRWEGKNLVANRLHEEKNSVLLKRRWFYASMKDKKLTHKNVVTMVETAIICNQVRMQEDCADTHKRATEGKSVAVVRRTKRRESRMLRGTSYKAGMVGLSNIRIQQLLGKKRHSALKIVKTATSLNLMRKKWRVDFKWLAGDPCNGETRKVFEDTRLIICKSRRTSFTRWSNVYSTQRNKYFNYAS